MSMKSINKHDILRTWVEREVIDLSINVYQYNDETGSQFAGSDKLNLSGKSIYVKIYDENGNLALSKTYLGTKNQHIEVVEDENTSKVVIHFLPNDYLTNFKASPAESKLFQMEMYYYTGLTEPPLTKNLFPHVGKTGEEIRLWIKLLRSRASA